MTGLALPSPTLDQLRRRVDRRVADSLARSSDLGLLGGMTLADQIDHSLGFVWSVESALGRRPQTVADLGSGGGVPGLILRSCWPDARLVLMDASQRRVDFLGDEVAAITGGTEVEVIRGRLEEIGRDPKYRQGSELVTSRSFGSPGVTAECGAPLLQVGGLMVVSEPPGDDADDRWPVEGLSRLGLGRSDPVRFEGRFGYRLLLKEGATPDRYPRRVGIPTKRPLF